MHQWRTARAATPRSPVLTVGRRNHSVEAALRLMDIPVWVGHPATQREVDETLTMLVSRVLGPGSEVPSPEAWLVASPSGPDLASARAAAASLARTARVFQDHGDPQAATACRLFAGALTEFASTMRASARSRERRRDRISALGSLRAIKTLAAECRAVRSVLKSD